MSIRILFPSAVLGVWLLAAPAWADPTKQECVSANESAQDLRHAGKLRQARASLAVCTATSCPGAVREDCGHQLRDLEAAQPTVVFEGKDSEGHDLSAVRVSMDGELLVEKLDGTAIAVDPGEHHFEFEAEGLKKTGSTVVVREGEKNRAVRVVLQSPVAPKAVAATPSSSFLDPGTRRVVGLTIGGAGVAGVIVGAVFGLMSKSTYDHAVAECGPQGVHFCSSSQAMQDRQSAYTQAAVSTVAFIAGGVLAAGGAALFLTAPAGGAEVGVGPSVTTAGGGFTLRGKW